MKKYFVKLMSRLLHSTIHQSDVIFLRVDSESIFLFMEYFFLKETVFPLVSSLIADLVSLDTSGKPIMGIFLKTASPS